MVQVIQVYGTAYAATSPSPRSLSFTDDEYTKLGQLATAAKLGRSEYIVAKLGLAK
ncbi:MAG: hypothetical protein ACRYFX_12910 [Janthinobacterium lividum]